MTTRNLTHGDSPTEDDSLNSSSSNSIQNPFNNDNNNNYNNNNNNNNNNDHYEVDDGNYKVDEYEYSTDSSTPPNKRIETVYAENDKSSSSQALYLPPEYERYSRSQYGSRADSMSSSQDGSKSSLLSGATSGNPFVMDSDFSPFGGYPLSSFPLHIEEEEPDDYLHNPDPILDLEYDKNRFFSDLKNMDKRSAGGFVGLILLLCGIIAVFIILPVITYTGVADHKHHHVNTQQHKNHSSKHVPTMTILTDYVYPQFASIRTSLVDPDTPEDAMTREAKDGSEWKLVFSDEFNVEGRSFYDGDEQFWYGADFNYGATKDLEWYDPDAITTANGSLQLRMDAIKQHDLYYRSGMLHSWNRMCFTQGIMEVSVRLPNYGNVTGLWPGLWSMGNLGRPGYMATTEGVWPYSYEACDAGITANQSSSDGISYLPGQKLNSCTCPGEDHPNPGVGRGAPEIDIFEGEVDTTDGVGVASQSLQLLPMDIWYYPDYSWIEIYNKSVSTMNTYTGGPFQEAVSATTTLNTTWYQIGDFDEGRFQKYSFEYLNDNDDGYIRWFVGDDPTMTVHAYALAPNGNVDWRRISKEPMSMILNLGISTNWAYIDWPSIKFPAIMEIDHVRVYQPEDQVLLTCDPDDYPTYDYIQDHLVAYENYNFTSWERAGYSIPKNNLTGC